MKEEKTTSLKKVNKWLEEENLILLEGWMRDGYSLQDISNRIGIDKKTLNTWRRQYPKINEALRKGAEVVDYQVESALLKSALGYKTKEIKITTTLNRRGEVVETVKVVLKKEQAPNVSAAQCWLYNRRPDKWKNMNSRSNIIDNLEDDTSIQITVTRPNKKDDEEWRDVNESVELRKPTKEEIQKEQTRRRREKKKERQEKEGPDVVYEE